MVFALRVPDDADALLARRLVALLFADDFNALSDTPQGLQKAVGVTYEWCCKWRIKANVGPNKSAVMLFAPECAQRPLQAGEIVWGSEPLPVVDKYNYLGVPGRQTARGRPMWSMWWPGHQSQLCHGQRAAQSQVGYGDTQGGTISQAAAGAGVLFHGLACGY
jgi:hypothetical protein